MIRFYIHKRIDKKEINMWNKFRWIRNLLKKPDWDKDIVVIPPDTKRKVYKTSTIVLHVGNGHWYEGVIHNEGITTAIEIKHDEIRWKKAKILPKPVNPLDEQKYFIRIDAPCVYSFVGAVDIDPKRVINVTTRKAVNSTPDMYNPYAVKYEEPGCYLQCSYNELQDLIDNINKFPIKSSIDYITIYAAGVMYNNDERIKEIVSIDRKRAQYE